MFANTIKALLLGSALLAIQVDASESYRVETLASGLDKPWSIAALPEGGWLVTEKSGQLLQINEEGSVSKIDGAPAVFFKSQGGLLDVVVDPDFSNNKQVYLSYSAGDGAANKTTVAKATLNDNALADLQVIFAVEPSKSTAAHYGGKLAFLADGTLLVSVGEGYNYREQAQSLDSQLGKLIRINTDGTAPADNPFPEKAPMVYSYGHRNPQGLVVDHAAGTIYMSEHGPKGGDELNVIQAGANYGWPAITYGVDYSGAIISPFTEAEGMEQPLTYWVPSIGPSGLAIYRGAQFEDWQGDLFTGALKDKKLYRLSVNADGKVEQSEPFPEISGRVRDVRVFNDGAIYLVTDEGDFLRVSASVN